MNDKILKIRCLAIRYSLLAECLKNRQSAYYRNAARIVIANIKATRRELFA